MRGLGFQSMAPFGLRRVRQRVERSSSENLSTAERRAAGAEASGESFFLGGGEGKGHWVSGWRSLLHSQSKLAAGAVQAERISPTRSNSEFGIFSSLLVARGLAIEVLAR